MAGGKAGRYQLQEELGRGAMGVVWKGFDPTIGRSVAVKTMRLTTEDSGLSRQELITRFQNETRAAGLLTHPNIVVIYDAGEDQGTFYITMELVEGHSLLYVIEQKQAFPIMRVIKVIEQACAALEYAHQRNVVHRDVKPANILLAHDDTVKITDFGTAKIVQMGTTQTGTIAGTPSYMSPEQIKGRPIDGRADVFSLGVILYELVTGEKPFPGQNVTTVIYKIVHEDPIPPRELDSSVHPGLSHVIAKALEKDPANRYQSCRALIEDLKNYRKLGGEPEIAETVVVPSKSTLPPPPATPTPPPPPQFSGTIIAGPFAPRPGALEPPPVAARPPEPTPPPQAAPPPRATAPPTAPAARPAETAPRAVAPAARSVRLTVEEAQPRRGGMIWLVLFLLAVIAGGGYLAWPTLLERLHLGGASQTPATSESQQPVATEPAATKSTGGTPAKAPAQPAEKKAAENPPTEPPVAAKEEAAPPTKSKAEPTAAAKADASEIKTQMERRLAQAGVADKVRVEIKGNTVSLVGSLTAAERRRLTNQLRGVGAGRGMAGWKLDNRIQLERAAAGEGEEKPRTAPGLGEIEVVTDVLGATAAIKGPGGSPSADCKTPCRFEELPPGRYTMSVTLVGYRTVNRILNVRAGSIVEENLQLDALTSEMELTSSPDRAAIWINGERRTEVTPATLALPPGSYAVALEKAGYQRHELTVQLRADELKRINVELAEARGGAPATQAPAPAPAKRSTGWLDVRSIPPGADVLIDGTNTGRKTPARIELPAGEHTVVIYVKGYQAVRKTVTIGDGLTFTINEVLPKSQ